MAIVLEQQTDEEFLGDNSTTEFNMVHTVPAGQLLHLLVIVTLLNDDVETIDTLVWDPEGVNEGLTFIGAYTEADDSRAEAWYYSGPTPGAAKNVEVIFTSAPLTTAGVVVCAYALSGVHATPIRDWDGQNDPTSATITAVLAAAQSGDFLAIGAHIENPTSGDLDASTVVMTTVYEGGTRSNSKHIHGHGVADGAGETLVATWGAADHTAGIGVALIPGITTTYEISGITKNKAGVALGSCLCFLCKDNGNNTASFIAYTLSNASTGAYAFTGLEDDDPNYFVIAWKDDSPHVFDVTDYILTPIEE